jgi:imidazolonepropionase-like amidohydrolase
MKRSKTIALHLVLYIWTAAISSCAPPPDYSQSDLYYGFTLIDPAKETVLDNAYLIVTDGRFREIGSGEPPQFDFRARRDLSGRFGLPGFIDAHAHITAGPHKMALVNGAPVVTIESVDEITQFNARMALAFGVTTVRNPAGDPAANARYDDNVRSGTWVGPDAVHAGAAVQPPPFGGNAFVYPRTDDDWKAEAKRQADLGMKYFKLYVSLTEDELVKGIRAAHEHGLRAVAHVDRVSWTRAVQLGIDDLTHALPTSSDLLPPTLRAEYLASLGANSKFMYRWFELVDFDHPSMQELIDLLVKRQIRVDLTLVVNQLIYNADNIDRVFPIAERRYSHTAVREAAGKQLKASAVGWTGKDFRRARAVMPKVLQFARRLYDAGVPLMIGTDGHGGTPTYARELKLHVDAGIPVWDVLRLSTSRSAQLLDLGNKTGRFEVGLEADIVFLNSDPLKDVANVKDVDTVVTNGRAYSFKELTASPGLVIDFLF